MNRYIFSKDASFDKIPMTTPEFTQVSDDKLSDVSIQIVLPMNKDLNKYPVQCMISIIENIPLTYGFGQLLKSPNSEAIALRKLGDGIAAVKKFSRQPQENIVLQKERKLRSQLLKDGLKPQEGCLLARYNDPRTQSFVMERGSYMVKRLLTGIVAFTVYCKADLCSFRGCLLEL